MAVESDLAALVGLLAKVADISFLLDEEGGITRVAPGAGELATQIDDSWQGRSLLDTVEGDSRQRLADALAAAVADPDKPLRLDLAHTLENGTPLPDGRRGRQVLSYQPLYGNRLNGHFSHLGCPSIGRLHGGGLAGNSV